MGYGSISKEESERREELFKNGIRICYKCKRELALDMFTKDCTNKYGLSSICKECQKKQRQERKPKIDAWFENNKDKVKQRNKEYSETHAEQKRQYNQQRKEYFKQKRKEYEAENIEKVREQRRNQRAKLSTRYKKYKREADERGLNFELSIEQFDEITKEPCFYCGDFGQERNGVKYNGVDRINSLDGYNISNCVPCCKTCNRMKMNLDLMDFLEHVKKIVNYTFGMED